MRPTSRGFIKLNSRDPKEHPIIQPRYLSTEYDRLVLRSALKAGREVMQQKAFDLYRGRELRPGTGTEEWRRQRFPCSAPHDIHLHVFTYTWERVLAAPLQGFSELQSGYCKVRTDPRERLPLRFSYRLSLQFSGFRVWVIVLKRKCLCIKYSIVLAILSYFWPVLPMMRHCTGLCLIRTNGKDNRVRLSGEDG